ncbi:ABC transporter ATP-binding protein [Streptomyces sp. A7024]|uniref:ABC transporter ATP-binding protein n=1 Tax=Streptomyces coryli TaxID=1128680 RepID=A0A6G4TYP5_9ACTN|nr:ABC transporter ATP-binding protein [Streptomyces coryli]NGN64943.1 ABC transporter ATP-binding protein [Streptomyces coryli]
MTVDQAQAQAPPALAATDIVVRFGGVTALDRVSVAAAPGEIVGLIGPNGAGKTTLFDALSGLRRPDAGRVLLGGADVTRRAPVWRARNGLRRTFQRQQLFGQLTVADNLLVAQEWRGNHLAAARARRAARADDVLARTGLQPLRERYAGTLPVGQARMVELARALADPPSVLLLDEPASGMTKTERARLADVVRETAQSGDCAVVVVEHDVGFVMELCSRVVVLDLGRVLAEGTPTEIRDDFAVKAAYLGTSLAGNASSLDGG